MARLNDEIRRQLAMAELKNAQKVSGSTCVANVEYDPETLELEIEFVGPPYGGSGTWTYFEVPPDEAAGLLGAGSKGEYFNQYIRDRYSFERTA